MYNYIIIIIYYNKLIWSVIAENETTDNATQEIRLTLIMLEAIGHGNQKNYSSGRVTGLLGDIFNRLRIQHILCVQLTDFRCSSFVTTGGPRGLLNSGQTRS